MESNNGLQFAEVPYYRQILPTFALYIGKNKNLGHLMDYAQRKRLNLGELIHETLEILEAHGGPDSLQIPTDSRFRISNRTPQGSSKQIPRSIQE